jgi:hypothetical protein
MTYVGQASFGKVMDIKKYIGLRNEIICIGRNTRKGWGSGFTT